MGAWRGATAMAGMLMVLGGCTRTFVPTLYELRDDLVPTLGLAGPVQVENAQPSSETLVVYSYGGTTLESNLNAITELMVQQTESEIRKHGRPGEGEGAKSIALSVQFLRSEARFYHWQSDIRFQVVLGDGQEFELAAHHGSAAVDQDLNGCIAQGVATLLNDPRVVRYLGSS